MDAPDEQAILATFSNWSLRSYFSKITQHPLQPLRPFGPTPLTPPSRRVEPRTRLTLAQQGGATSVVVAVGEFAAPRLRAPPTSAR